MGRLREMIAELLVHEGTFEQAETVAAMGLGNRDTT